MNGPSASRFKRLGVVLHRSRTVAKKAAPFAAGVLAALLALVIYHAIFPAPHQLTSNEMDQAVAKAMASATPPPAFSVGAYQSVAASIVLVQSYPPGAAGKQDDLGSGVVIDDRGDILTSLHVVAGAGSIVVTFYDGTQSSAQVTVQQPENDIAVLQADQPPAKLTPATLGNPNAMSVGDEAYVVGNPFGLYSSMTAGVISGFNRSFQPTGSDVRLKGLIQIDTPVNPGNSGGPLVNRNGEVIGIVEGIVNPTGQDVNIGIGFAVPITTAGGAVGSPPD